MLDTAKVTRNGPTTWRVELGIGDATISYDLESSGTVLGQFTDMAGFKCPDSL